VLEAGNVGSHFGAERLLELLHATPCRESAEAVVDAVFSALGDHTGHRLDDDVAVVALQLVT